MSLLPTAHCAAARNGAALARSRLLGKRQAGQPIPDLAALTLLVLAAMATVLAAPARAEDQPRLTLEDTGLSVTIAKTVPGYVKNGGGGSGNTGPLISRSWLPFLMTSEACRARLIDELISTVQDAGLASALPATRPTLPDGAGSLNFNLSETYITVACHKLR